MPVGTLANVKTLLPEEVAALGYRLILANTYHLHLQPGEDVVASLGGAPDFMGWPHAMLTDSGGFQVFSLAGMREISEEGVRFDARGGPRFISPESAMAIQRDLGADIAMAFDECTAVDSYPAVQRLAMERTHRWAERCVAQPAAPGQARFGIAQGGMRPEWRTESARFIAALPFDGYAIGGLSLGEKREATWELAAAAVAELPAAKARYLMGFGAPEDLINGVWHGVDMFDCVLPTRLARHGAVMTFDGRYNLKRAEHARSDAPLEPDCPCPACAYPRWWVRRLLMDRVGAALRLLSLHNLAMLARLMEQIRSAIAEKRFAAYRASALARLGSPA